MIQIRLLKDWESKKAGDIINISQKGGDAFVHAGGGEYILESKETSLDLKSLEKSVEKYCKKNNLWVSKNDYLKLKSNKEEGLRLLYHYLLNFPENVMEKTFEINSLPDKPIITINKGDGKILGTNPLKISKECEGKIEIQLPKSGRLISEFINDIINPIKKENILFFRNDARQIVEVGKINHNEENKQSFTGFIPVKPSRFITLVEKLFTPGHLIMVKEGDDINFKFKPKSMTKDLGNTILDSYILEENLPNIYRIFTTPIPIMHNGELTFPKIGYDERFNSWLPPNSPMIKDVNLSLKESKSIIHNLLKEFCFQTKEDFDISVAGLITPFLRGLYSRFNCRTPVFLYLGNRERIGKDYLAGLDGILYEGIALEEPSICGGVNNGNGNEELRKKILSALLSGRKRLHFANNKGFLNNSVFEGIITAEAYSDRILGKNEAPIFENELEFSLSGNVGIGFTPDLANRSRVIRLFYDQEDTNKRQFVNPDLHKFVLENRGLILSAIYGLVKNWVNAGSPDGSVPFASFPEWARVCGGIMESAGYESPCNPSKEDLALGGDSETTDMKSLFEHCFLKRPNIPLTKKDIRDLIGEEDIFGYFDFSKRADQTKFANKILKFVGRVLSDIRLKVVDSSVRTSRQQYIFIEDTQNRQKKDILKEHKTESGNLGNLGNPITSLKHKTNILYNKGIQPLPTVTRVTKVGNNNDTKAEPPEFKEKITEKYVKPVVEIVEDI